MKMMRPWFPHSWQEHASNQQPNYPSATAVDDVIRQLVQLPPLVTHFEIEQLKQSIALAQTGQRFLLQGGDCAESFHDCTIQSITNKLKILLQMSLVMMHGMHKPIIRVGRMAGQYAKPRSADTETRNGVTLPSYRGDLINDATFTLAARTPNPLNMLKGYHYSAATLNYIRALVSGGFANLYHPEYWQIDFASSSASLQGYQTIVDNITQALQFLRVIPGMDSSQLERVDFYTSHEALLLPYEQSLTRHVADNDRWYNLSTHFPWIGMRTAQPHGAHIEYMRGISNPIAIKIGPDVTQDALLQVLDKLNPDNEPGRITLIHRMGHELISKALPPLLHVIKQSGHLVLWSCDPMHGNTHLTSTHYKTRRFDDILSELKQAFLLHHQAGTYLGGVHLELTGDNVTECIGGAQGLTEHDLHHAYKSPVDPRLNYEQALEIASLITHELASAI